MREEAHGRGQIIKDLERRYGKSIEQIVIEVGQTTGSDAEAAEVLSIKRGTYRWLRWRQKLRRKTVVDVPQHRESA